MGASIIWGEDPVPTVEARVFLDICDPSVVRSADGTMHAVPFSQMTDRQHRATRDTVCGRRVRCVVLAKRASTNGGESIDAALVLVWPPPARGHGTRCPDCYDTVIAAPPGSEASKLGSARRPDRSWKGIDAELVLEVPAKVRDRPTTAQRKRLARQAAADHQHR